MGKLTPEGVQAPGFVTIAAPVILQESWLAPSSRLLGVWHVPSWRAVVQSVPAEAPPQVVEPSQQVSWGFEQLAPMIGPQVQGVHWAGPAGLLLSVKALRLGGQPGAGRPGARSP